MTGSPTKVREWSQRLHRFQKSGMTITQFCQDEKVSVPSFYHWRNQIQSESKCKSTPETNATQASSFRFTIHAGEIKIECQADSMHSLDAILAWAARNQETCFQQLIVQR